MSRSPSYPYLHVDSFAVFVAQEDIDALVQRFEPDAALFEPVQKTITDHVGESALMTIIVTHGAEFLLLPFNDFHHELDFEIGLTLDRASTILAFEQAIASRGWEYESGTMEQDETRPYYLIPTRSGAFPCFFVVSSTNVAENEYRTSFKSLHAGVRSGAVNASVDFAAQFCHPDIAGRFTFEARKQNRFISASFETDLPRSVEMDEQIGGFRFGVRDSIWTVSVAE